MQRAKARWANASEPHQALWCAPKPQPALTFLERGMMLLGRTSRRFLQLSTGRVRAATHVPSEDEETMLSRCFLCKSSSASWPSP